VSQQLKTVAPENSPDWWDQRVDALGIRLETGPLWPLIEQVGKELRDAGLTFQPAYYVANEWGCPDGLPLIGIPFYLADTRFYAYEEEHADDLEDDTRILQGIRHELGHAVCYAYRLYLEPEWERLFGSFGLKYHDDYRPIPFSRRCVRHLPGFYAQKHPDEDFAETFAVWLEDQAKGAQRKWREKYAGWDALAKLEYVDATMARIGGQIPLIDPRSVQGDPQELAFTVGEFYTQRAIADAPPVAEIQGYLDDDLREIFQAEGLGIDAASLVRDRRKAIMRSVSAHSGARLYVVKALLDSLAQRLRTLGLRAAPGKEIDAVIATTSLAASLTTNFLLNGPFVQQ
jgi:hypothetical protein